MNSAIIPLAVLCVCLCVGGVASIFLTRRIARIRLVQEMERAARARLEAQRMEERRPVLVDVYIQRPREGMGEMGEMEEAGAGVPGRGWAGVLPLSALQNETLCCPHPHRTIEHRAGYDKNSLVDGNVLEVSVGIAMPRHPSRADLDMIAPLESFEYCIGTSETVVCSLLGARQRLLGIN